MANFLSGLLMIVLGSAVAFGAETHPPVLGQSVLPLRGCTECHSHAKPQGTGHQDLVTKHFGEAKKCSTCHASGHVEQLQLLTGDRTAFIPELCGQCHGIEKRDWNHGIHGKQFGGWQKSSKVECTYCHNAHDPKFKSMKAMPAPTRPKLGIEKGESHD